MGVWAFYFCGNFTLHGNSVYFFLLSLEWLGIFKSNLTALIKEVEIIWNPMLKNRDYLPLHSEAKTLIGDALWWIKLANDFVNLATWLVQKSTLVSKLHTVLLSNFFHANFNFIFCTKDNYLTEVLHTRKYFQEKSSENPHDVIYKPIYQRASSM